MLYLNFSIIVEKKNINLHYNQKFIIKQTNTCKNYIIIMLSLIEVITNIRSNMLQNKNNNKVLNQLLNQVNLLLSNMQDNSEYILVEATKRSILSYILVNS